MRNHSRCLSFLLSGILSVSLLAPLSSAQAAYDDFSKDASMNYYLGPYYDDILYKYSLRKNNG